jgi:hypothetical protein
MWRLSENRLRKKIYIKGGRGFTAAPAGRLRLGSGFFRRRSGGGLDPRAGNPTSVRGMLDRALARIPRGMQRGAVAAEREGERAGFAGEKEGGREQSYPCAVPRSLEPLRSPREVLTYRCAVPCCAELPGRCGVRDGCERGARSQGCR